MPSTALHWPLSAKQRTRKGFVPVSSYKRHNCFSTLEDRMRNTVLDNLPLPFLLLMLLMPTFLKKVLSRLWFAAFCLKDQLAFKRFIYFERITHYWKCLSWSLWCSHLSFTNKVSEWAKQTKEHSEVKGINFHIEKNLAPIYRDAKCGSVWE